MWFALATLGAVSWGVDLAQTYGLSPGDGGELRPLRQRLAVALGKPRSEPISSGPPASARAS
jgi:hypothetical protein